MTFFKIFLKSLFESKQEMEFVNDFVPSIISTKHTKPEFEFEIHIYLVSKYDVKEQKWQKKKKTCETHKKNTK